MKHLMRVVFFLMACLTLLGVVLFLPQNNRCDLDRLIVQDNMMPTAWKRRWQVLPPALPKEGAQDALNVVYENGSEIAQDTIYRYKNTAVAFLYFRINNQLYFPSGLWRWSDLAGSVDWRLNGDESRIQCGDSDDSLLGYLCVAVVRYGSYISVFSSPIEEGTMSTQEFNSIVVDIDNQITSCIQSPSYQR